MGPWGGMWGSRPVPVETEVSEPILHQQHHVADGEEEGSDL